MNKLGWIFFFALVAYFIFFLRQDIIDNLDLASQLKSVKANLVKEETRGQSLQERLRRLRSQDYIEKLARLRLGLVIKGETAYKVMEAK